MNALRTTILVVIGTFLALMVIALTVLGIDQTIVRVAVHGEPIRAALGMVLIIAVDAYALYILRHIN